MRLWPSRGATTQTPTRAWRGGMFCMRAPLVVVPSLSSLFSPDHPPQLALLMFVPRNFWLRVLLSSVPPLPGSVVLPCL